MVLNIFLLIAGFVLLVFGADYLVRGAAGLARKFNVSELVIGLTIVAFGTSMPELVVSIVSSTEGLNEVVYGNVIGSNIFNLYLILGICGLIYPMVVERSTVKKEIPYSLLAVVILFMVVNDRWLRGSSDYFSRFDAGVLIVFFIFFLIYTSRNLKKERTDETTSAKHHTLLILVIMIIGGLGGLIWGGRIVVDNAVVIARTLNISEKLIGLSIIAAGTSLPELATSAVAAFKKNSNIAIGNIVGSNIFNIFFILSVSGLISPMDYNRSLNLDLFILMGGTLLLFIFFQGKNRKLSRIEAAVLLVGYIAYLLYLIKRG